MLYIGVLPRIENDFLKKDSKESDSRKKDLRKIIVSDICWSCHGKRLNKKVLSCKINGKDISDCSALPVDELLQFVQSLSSKSYETILKELSKKLENIVPSGFNI